MSLPNFLGVGVVRGGSTWLHTLLATHPDVFMPTRRKEIRFFDKYYDLGLGWYEKFFPPPDRAVDYRAIGEISPQYYRCDKSPQRILETFPDNKLIFMLRHPVGRAYSHYGFYVQRRNFTGSFEEFVTSLPKSLEHGFYSKFIKRYLARFDRSQILVMLFENAVTNTSATKSTLARFLDLDANRFPTSAGGTKVNASSVPRSPLLYGVAATAVRRLRQWRFESFVDYVRLLGVEHWLAKGSTLPPLDQDLARRISKQYESDFAELEDCLEMDFSCWRDLSFDRPANVSNST